MGRNVSRTVSGGGVGAGAGVSGAVVVMVMLMVVVALLMVVTVLVMAARSVVASVLMVVVVVMVGGCGFFFSLRSEFATFPKFALLHVPKNYLGLMRSTGCKKERDRRGERDALFRCSHLARN